MAIQDRDKSKAQLLAEIEELRCQVTELEEAAQTRHQTELTQGRLLENLNATTDFVGIADVSGRSLYLNPAGRRMVGMAPDEPETKPLV